MNNTELGNLFKTARKAQSLSQLELQNLSGVSVSVLYKLENGRTDIAFGSFLAIADALGIQSWVKSPLGEEIKLDG